MTKSTNRFWYQHTQHQVITLKICTILHPRLDIIAKTDIHDITKGVCNRTQGKKSMSKHHIYISDSDYNYFLI